MSNPPKLAIVPASAMPPDPGSNQKIATQRVTQAPTVRDAAFLALQIASTCRAWIQENENLIAAMARLTSRLADHVQALEERAGVDGDKTLKAEVEAAVKQAAAAVEKQKIEQPPPKGEGLREVEPGVPLLDQLREGEQILLEDSITGERRWVTADDPINPTENAIRLGPKPPTQGIGFNGPIPKLSDPDVPSPTLGQPPEKPA